MMRSFEEVFKTQIEQIRTGAKPPISMEYLEKGLTHSYSSGRPFCIGDHMYYGLVLLPEENPDHIGLITLINLHREEYGTIYIENPEYAKELACAHPHHPTARYRNDIERFPFLILKE